MIENFVFIAKYFKSAIELFLFQSMIMKYSSHHLNNSTTQKLEAQKYECTKRKELKGMNKYNFKQNAGKI